MNTFMTYLFQKQIIFNLPIYPTSKSYTGQPCFFVWSLGWLWTLDPHASASWMLGFQECATELNLAFKSAFHPVAVLITVLHKLDNLIGPDV
jgi:hypothetical protein